MTNVPDQQNSQDIKPNIISHDSQTELPNNAAEGAIPDSGSVTSVSASSNGNGKVSREDIELVQNLIERCKIESIHCPCSQQLTYGIPRYTASFDSSYLTTSYGPYGIFDV